MNNKATLVLIVYLFFYTINSMAQNNVENDIVALQENVFVCFNKPYYYHNERVWFKSYMMYADINYRDSLSKVLYIDVISPKGNIILSQKLKINEGETWGDFHLSDTLSTGTYRLRTYTNLMRNFGDSTIQYFPFYLIENDQLPLTNLQSKKCDYILSKESVFQKRQKVILDLAIPNLKSYSVSVTDTFAVKQISQFPYSLKIYPELSLKEPFKVKYNIEQGLTLKGIALDVNKKPKETELNIYSYLNKQLFSLNTSKKGEFELNIEDNISNDKLTISPANTNRIINVILTKIDKPTVNSSNIPEIGLQKKMGSYLEKDTLIKSSILLEEVKVHAKKENHIWADKDRLYGRPDAVVSGEAIFNAQVSNPVSALQGRVPGVRIFSLNGRIVLDMRGIQQSSFSGKIQDPMILVDGFPFAISSLNDLEAISPANIDRIEVVKRVSTIFGANGANGIIAIYTKNSQATKNIGNINQEPNKNAFTFEIDGFYKPNSFSVPNYSSDESESSFDSRKTIYWKPDGKVDETGKAQITFYTADTSTIYRVEIVGVQNSGNLVKCVKYLEVK